MSEAAAGNLRSSGVILVTRHEAVATVTLNRPEQLNALTLELGQALLEALNGVAQDKSIRALVITGAGRGFCAGGDLKALRDARERMAVHDVEKLLLTGKKIVMTLNKLPKPVLASVNGPAAGAGCNLALACGLRIASDRAIFAQSFAKVGLFPDFGGTYFLKRIVGPSVAAEMLYTGEAISAAEAARVGMVSRVVPHDQLAAETAILGSRLAAAPPMTVHGIKQMIFGDDREALERALDEEIRWQLMCFQSEDCKEGLAAFFESRPAHFRGE